MTTIQLTFPWGRYYAHPWGINPTRLREPEWPPSPWRLLRALVSAWFRANPGKVPSEECIELVETLGRELPLIGTGKVSFGHTVHWQPNYGAAGTEDRADASYKNTRHENHFAAVPGPVFFRWKGVSLASSLEFLLRSLLAELSYFGRAESLCHAELTDEEPGKETGWCEPTDGRKISSSCRDVFCAMPDDFEFADLWSKRGDPSRPDPLHAPPHLGDRLLATNMKADGSGWRSYQMPPGWPHQWIVRTPRQQRAATEGPTNLSYERKKVARYLRFSLQCRVPIPQRFTVDIAEKFRSAANSYIKEGVKSFALLGKPEDRPDGVEGDHQHAFFLPTSENSSPPGFLTDVHIWCPMGFTRAEVDLFLKVRRLGWKDHRYPANPVLVAMGMEPAADAIISTPYRKDPSRIWRSASPFVPALHFYTGSKDKPRLKKGATPEEQLVNTVRKAGINTGCTVRRLRMSNQEPHGLTHSDDLPPQLAWDIVRAPADTNAFDGGVATKTHQNGSDDSPIGYHRRIGFMLELEFDEPVILPRPAFGHSSHFGLGLFVPA